MPEMRFVLRWPDGAEQSCYSPSSVIKQHFCAGQSYGLAEFLARSRSALHIASDRVEAKYGMPCARALSQLADIEQSCLRFADHPDPRIVLVAFRN